MKETYKVLINVLYCCCLHSERQLNVCVKIEIGNLDAAFRTKIKVLILYKLAVQHRIKLKSKPGTLLKGWTFNCNSWSLILWRLIPVADYWLYLSNHWKGIIEASTKSVTKGITTISQKVDNVFRVPMRHMGSLSPFLWEVCTCERPIFHGAIRVRRN